MNKHALVHNNTTNNIYESKSTIDP